MVDQSDKRSGDLRNVQRIGFALIPNFGLMSYASAIEPLRAANLLSGTHLYEPVALSVTGAPVRCSVGLEVGCRAIAEHGKDCHIVNRQAILTPYRHPKMPPLERRDSWPDAV